MEKNVGKIDRAVRIVGGLAVLSLIFILEGNIRWLGLLGIVPIVIAVVGVCPLYSLFGISTKK